MKIRTDFEPIASFIGQLEIIGNLLKEKERHWIHFKHEEDYDKLYELPQDEVRLSIENIYAKGRGCAMDMYSKLTSFNDFSEYPTLISYIDSLESSLEYYFEMDIILNNAKESACTLQYPPCVLHSMFIVFQEQINLLTVVKNTLIEIKKSDIYKRQKGDMGASVLSPSLEITSDVVELAIKDVEILLQENRPISGVDRIHTALHGYLKEACNKASISYTNHEPMKKLFNLLREKHPNLQSLSAAVNILDSFTSIINELNTSRNTASLAHPNSNLVEKDEAWLLIHSTRTILHYLDAKLAKTH